MKIRTFISFRKNRPSDSQSRENLWFDALNKVINRVLYQFANQLMDQISTANILYIFNTVASAAGMYTLLAPYFVAFALHAKQRRFARVLQREFPHGAPNPAGSPEIPKTAIFADSYKKLKDAVCTPRTGGHDGQFHPRNMIGITCDTEQRSLDMLDIKNFDPIGVYDVAGCPGIQLYYPPVIDMLNYCYEQHISRIHVLTPGPLGLAGLLIARILKLPINSTYQSALPAFALFITKDEGMTHIVHRCCAWFYNQMGSIYATSAKIAKKMVQEGIRSEKIKMIESWKDRIESDPLKEDLLKNFFQLPINWKFSDSLSSPKAAT